MRAKKAKRGLSGSGLDPAAPTLTVRVLPNMPPVDGVRTTCEASAAGNFLQRYYPKIAEQVSGLENAEKASDIYVYT